MEIDHIFIFVDPDGVELKYLASLGLVETYRRTHRGQGTQNICFCFDNMFLECLWVIDPDELRSETIARTGLYERAQWRSTGTCPFGIAWRCADEDFRTTSWEFRPPYLPAGIAIEVSIDGDDPRQPMMFCSPGSAPPAQWAPGRRGALQRAAGLGRVLALRLDLPQAIAPSPALAALARATFLEVRSHPGETHSLTCEVERLGNDKPLIIQLPVYVQ